MSTWAWLTTSSRGRVTYATRFPTNRNLGQGPREPQDGPKSAQERAKSAPRVHQKGVFRAPGGQG
eukprot:2467372-Pyramimonas_sp.AAC.1